jgi:hypothetical protein
MKRVLERKSKAAWHSRVAFCVAFPRALQLSISFRTMLAPLSLKRFFRFLFSSRSRCLARPG